MAQYPDSYYSIAEVIGDEAARKLCEAYGGEAIYVPKLDTLEAVERVAAIRREYNGSNVAKLARKYNLTQMRVYQIVQDLNPQIDGQISMLDNMWQPLSEGAQ
jgi:Mor family transcriptional regulator